MERIEFNNAFELRNYDNFFLPASSSALSKYLTRSLWEEYKDKRDAAGIEFRTCIFSGIKNIDSAIGAYAGSHDSYRSFNKLFDKIIEDYHGLEGIGLLGNKKLTDISETSPLRFQGNLPILSTRIRLARNLAGYPLTPGVSKQMRLEILNKVKDACLSLGGDLKGSFHMLEHMDEITKKKLVENHILFREGDRFQKWGNICREWPSGRAIFYNREKTLIIWVNEEDHLRIISLQTGDKVQEVYERLLRAEIKLSALLNFSQDHKLGYINSCPTNLGTGLRASVHLKVPNLMKNKNLFQSIAERSGLQIRGKSGEHSDSRDGIFDISNKGRLGKTKSQYILEMIKGVQILAAVEEKM